MCAVTANLGTWAPAFKDMALAPAARMRVALRIRQPLTALLSVLVLTTQLAASNTSLCNRLHSSVWTAGRLATELHVVQRSATALLSDCKNAMSLSQTSVLAPRRLQLSFVHSL